MKNKSEPYIPPYKVSGKAKGKAYEIVVAETDKKTICLELKESFNAECLETACAVSLMRG
jgi:hypothetical protein